MKPDWDKLMGEFDGSPSSLVADVDCTGAGQPLCEKNGVQGYPSIKWGDPSDLQDYKGGRSFDDLKKFADENLGPTCGPKNLDLCNDKEKAQIKKFTKMDLDELEMDIEEGDAKIKSIEEASKKKSDGLQSKISDLQSKIQKENRKKDSAVEAKNKELNMKFKKAVAAKKKKDEAPPEPEEKPAEGGEEKPAEEKKEEL
mmetsp:Transcript_143527/g.250290  ORF Transcript_143527/g.250290 Transcript_143527/m.250290 type:complete len:199 (+) Transcript_143527:191-787(+)